jgi:hypothetical protein
LERPPKSVSIVSRTTRLRRWSRSPGQPDEEPFEVVLAGLRDLAALDVHVIDDDLVLGDEGVEIESQRADVLSQLLGRLLERHEDARLAEFHGAADDVFKGEQRLPASGRAADERGAAARKSPRGDLVESSDPRPCLGDLRRARGAVRVVQVRNLHRMRPAPIESSRRRVWRYESISASTMTASPVHGTRLWTLTMESRWPGDGKSGQWPRASSRRRGQREDSRRSVTARDLQDHSASSRLGDDRRRSDIGTIIYISAPSPPDLPLHLNSSSW